jgi:hypothetical protein
VVTIFPPAGSLESAPGGRGAVVGEQHVLSQFFSQCMINNRIVSQLVERKNGVDEVFSCRRALYYSAVRAKKTFTSLSIFYHRYIFYNDFTFSIIFYSVFIQGGKVLKLKNCRHYFSKEILLTYNRVPLTIGQRGHMI